MKTFSLLLFICFLQSANAATYYFSTTSGNDSRTPSEAQNPATPWKTLRKLNSFFSNLKPGDAVLLKRGETFYGAITASKSGASGRPIIVGDYGTGNKPVITSLVTITNWISKGKGVWETNYSSSGSAVNMVLLNGVEQELGRYPNSNAHNKGYLTFESHTGTTSIKDNSISRKTDWKGAQLVLRSRRWTLDKNLITSSQGNKISYKASSRYAPYDNYGYFIQNSIKTLDKFGEWYYNPSANKLSIYFSNNNPSSYHIQVSTIDNLISSQKFSNISFRNLNIKGANTNGFYINGGANINIENCTIEFSGQDGAKVGDHTNFKMEGCTVANSNNNGIDLRWTGDFAIIRNNKIINTAIFAGMVGSGDGKGIGIHSNGNGNIIEYNDIRNTGYMPIAFNGDYVTVKNNFINNFCLIKDDGAGIYSHIGTAQPRKGRKVIGNIIINGIGAGEGTNNPTYLAVEGIYMDNNASDVDIRDNTVANCNNNGIYIHNSYGINVRNNTIYNNVIQLNMIEDPDNSRIRKCIIRDNIFFSKIPSQKISHLRASANDIRLFGTFNSNYYARPLDEKVGIYTSYVDRGGYRVNENFDLQGWKDKYGHDKESKKTARQIAQFKVNKVLSTNKFENGSFARGISGVTETSSNASWRTSGLLDGGYLQVDPKKKGSSVYINIGRVKAGKDYILKYSVKGAVESSMIIGAFLRTDGKGSGYRSLTPTQYRKVSVSRSNNELLFSPSTNQESVAVVFQVDSKNRHFIDNIEFHEADATITNPNDSIRFEYNASRSKRTIALNGNYIDVKGKNYSNNVTLAPYSSIILLKNNKDISKPSKNAAPVVRITSPRYGESFSESATISVSADATDSDGTISKVEFYNGKTLVATKYAKPYAYSFRNLRRGTYDLTVKATDNDRLATTSAVVRVKVGMENQAPAVKIVSPIDKKKFKGPATIRLIADAQDRDGKIIKVEFYNGRTLLITEYKYPYTYWWTGVRAGKYTITAIATDNKGRKTTSKGVEVSVVSSAQNKPSAIADQDGSENASIANDADSIGTALASKPADNSTLSLKLSPNPVNNILNIATRGVQQNEKITISIVSASGSVMKTIPSVTSNQIVPVDVSRLSNGVYFVKIVLTNKVLTQQFVKF